MCCSKFVEPGSWRIDYETDRQTELESVIVQQADLSFVAVFLNRWMWQLQLQISFCVTHKLVKILDNPFPKTNLKPALSSLAWWEF